MTDPPMKVLYCNCSYSQVVPAQVKGEVLRELTASGVSFQAVPDLCEMCARRDQALERIAAAADLRIAACFPRTVKWLFDRAGVPLDEERVEVLNMRTERAEAVVAGLMSETPMQRDQEP